MLISDCKLMYYQTKPNSLWYLGWQGNDVVGVPVVSILATLNTITTLCQHFGTAHLNVGKSRTPDDSITLKYQGHVNFNSHFKLKKHIKHAIVMWIYNLLSILCWQLVHSQSRIFELVILVRCNNITFFRVILKLTVLLQFFKHLL